MVLDVDSLLAENYLFVVVVAGSGRRWRRETFPEQFEIERFVLQ
jgi:hypothetical protein